MITARSSDVMDQDRDKPCEVIPGLYISSLNVAEQALQSTNPWMIPFKAIVSIGCPAPIAASSLLRLEFPVPKDLPETYLLNILTQTTAFVKDAQKHGAVLVHCVYGQSRSAAVIVAYLLSLRSSEKTGSSNRFTINEAISILRTARPCICINPGFLAQLFLLSDFLCGTKSDTFRLIQQTEMRLCNEVIPLFSNVDDINSTILCRNCGFKLCHEYDIISSDEAELKTFVAAHTDGFWVGYPPAFAKTKPKNTKKKNQELAIIDSRDTENIYCCWQQWMLCQVSVATEGAFSCPSCAVPIGSYKYASLPVAGSYLAGDRLCLKVQAITTKA